MSRILCMSKFDQIKNLFGQETQINIHKVYASMQILMEKFLNGCTYRAILTYSWYLENKWTYWLDIYTSDKSRQLKFIEYKNYTYLSILYIFLYINKISMYFCLFICLFVCLSVCPQTTPREMDRYSWMIHRWMRAFPGTKVVYFGTGYDYLVRKYTKKTNFGPPKYFDFFRFTKCRNFFFIIRSL